MTGGRKRKLLYLQLQKKNLGTSYCWTQFEWSVLLGLELQIVRSVVDLCLATFDAYAQCIYKDGSYFGHLRYDFCEVKPIIVISKIPLKNININENKLSRILASENIVLDCVCIVPFFL